MTTVDATNGQAHDLATEPRGEGAVSSMTPAEKSSAYAFLRVQETCLKAGLIEALGENVEQLRAMTANLKLSTRTRQRAQKLLLEHAKYAVPAPARTERATVLAPITIYADGERAQVRLLVANPAAVEHLLAAQVAIEAVPAKPVDLASNGHVGNGAA